MVPLIDPVLLWANPNRAKHMKRRVAFQWFKLGNAVFIWVVFVFEPAKECGTFMSVVFAFWLGRTGRISRVGTTLCAFN